MILDENHNERFELSSCGPYNGVLNFGDILRLSRREQRIRTLFLDVDLRLIYLRWVGSKCQSKGIEL